MGRGRSRRSLPGPRCQGEGSLGPRCQGCWGSQPETHPMGHAPLQKESQKADEYLREIKDQKLLPEAVSQCIEAAGYEHEPDTQKSLLRVSEAKGGFWLRLRTSLSWVVVTLWPTQPQHWMPLAGSLLREVLHRQVPRGELRAHVPGPAGAQCHPGLPDWHPPHLHPVSFVGWCMSDDPGAGAGSGPSRVSAVWGSRPCWGGHLISGARQGGESCRAA